jgi:succinate dehydrogenase/fumarate reductase flavoprotein subunit
MAQRRIIVVWHGAAGLCAALLAVETAQACGIDAQVPEAACGGNSRWSPSNVRMLSPVAMEPGFVDEIVAQSSGRADRAYFERLAAEAPATAHWLEGKGVAFHAPPYYLARGRARSPAPRSLHGRWWAPSRTLSAASKPTRMRAYSAATDRSADCMRRGKSPGISTGPRRMPWPCCARSSSAASRGETPCNRPCSRLDVARGLAQSMSVHLWPSSKIA